MNQSVTGLNLGRLNKLMEQENNTMATDLPERDAEGYLTDPADWNDEVAQVLAQEENIQLTDDHWDTIRFMRDYYDEHQVIPDARFVIKHLAERVGKDAQKKLFELYPYGYVQQACKIAGMRRPRAWSTG
jgi:TusE/DsrC/DsvC family sulfur relay protein